MSKTMLAQWGIQRWKHLVLALSRASSLLGQGELLVVDYRKKQNNNKKPHYVQQLIILSTKQKAHSLSSPVWTLSWFFYQRWTLPSLLITYNLAHIWGIHFGIKLQAGSLFLRSKDCVDTSPLGQGSMQWFGHSTLSPTNDHSIELSLFVL